MMLTQQNSIGCKCLSIEHNGHQLRIMRYGKRPRAATVAMLATAFQRSCDGKSSPGAHSRRASPE